MELTIAGDDTKMEEDDEAFELATPKRVKRVKRVIIQDSSSDDESDDEDDIPLNERKALNRSKILNSTPTKKIKLSSENKTRSTQKKVFDLTTKTEPRGDDDLDLSDEMKHTIKEPKILIKQPKRRLRNGKNRLSSTIDEKNDTVQLLHINRKQNPIPSTTIEAKASTFPLKANTKTSSALYSFNNSFKASVAPPPSFGSLKSLMPPSIKHSKKHVTTLMNNFNASKTHSSNNNLKTLDSSSNNNFKAPITSSNNNFKTPLPVTSNNGFKAPLPIITNAAHKPATTPTSNADFSVSTSSSSDDSFKAPATVPFESKASFPVFTAPQIELGTGRLSHYINSICDDLDRYNDNKKKMRDLLLTFRDTDDLPTLDITIMRKISSLITSVIKQHKNLDSIDMNKFGKIIKLMENTVVVATDIDIIELYGKTPPDEGNRELALKMLTLISDGFEACSMIFEILTTCHLDKQFLSRNLITNCLHFIKNQLDYTIYPLIDISHFEDEASSLTSNAHVFLSLIESSLRERRLLGTFIPSIIRFFRRTFTFICAEDLDDDVLVIVAYINMGPFFHDYSDSHKSVLLSIDSDENNTFNPYEQLKFIALDILKHIFSKYPKHRRWIFEEILTSIGTLTTMEEARKYRLRDNRSIHVISALFMQLVQCCSSLGDKASHKNWFMKWNIKYQKAVKGQDKDQIKALDDKLIRRASTAWRTGAEAAANSASFFLEFLMSKCKSRKKDSYSLYEYRQILDQTLQDIMTVFNDPEWPVAELIMRVFSRILLSLLEENHSDQFLKSLAIEWLGIISCKIKTGYNKLSGAHNMYTPEWMYQLNNSLAVKVDKDTPISSIALLDHCRKKLLDYVTEEKANINVNEFYLCNWGFIESVLWTKANKGWEVEEKKPIGKTKTSTTNEDNQNGKTIENNDDEMIDDNTLMDATTTTNIDMDLIEDEVKWSEETVLLLENTCKYYWLTCLGIEHPFPKSKVDHDFPEMSRADYFMLTELLASRQTLYTSFNFILSELLTCLEKDAVTYRTKTLKAIGRIAAEVPEIMEDQRIRTSVVQRIHDTSPSVRDSAVDVVAKYLSRLETVPIKLYEIVSGRIMDTAVNVRKRLVKLLQGLYFKFTDVEIKIDIASKLIMRIGDNEVTISQLSLKATQEILFLPFKEIEKDGNDYFGYSYANSPKSRKRKITDLTQIITGAVSKIDSSIIAQNIALSQIIEKTINGSDEKTMLWYGKVFQWIVDSLFDKMILLDEEDNSAEFVNCLATVYAFIKPNPFLLRESHVSMLQPYLSVSEDADWTKAHYVLAIYRDVFPYMKYHAPEFIQSVERVLMQLLGRCPLDLIADGVSCLCVIVDLISHRYNILTKILGSCIIKLQQVREVISGGGDPEARTYSGVLKMLMISGLLCQHFEFDKKREEEPEKMEALDLIYKGNICTLVFDILQFFTSESMDELEKDGMKMRMTALQGLGYFYASHPTFMISLTSTTLMDKIFEDSSTNELKIQLMRVFQEFLSVEEKRIGKRERIAGDSLYTKDIDIDTLLGNTEEHAELGVNGSLMQRYLRKILRCALDESDQLRYAAFEVVSSVIHQGLAHPVLCMPVIVAAETSSDIILRNKAYYLHRYAHDKYGSLLYIQLSEYLSTSYQYQKILRGSDYVPGYDKRGGDTKVDAVLGVTYSVLKEKRKPKMDFLTALVKPFEFDLKSTTSDEVDINYLRYLSENITTLNLANTEEVLHMVYIMNRILMTLGVDLLQYIHFLKKQEIISTDPESAAEGTELDPDFIVASKLAIAMCILLYMKNLLVELYDIPDDEIREYNPNIKRKPRDVTKDLEMNGFINWDELRYFKDGKLNKLTASDACLRFEYLYNTIHTIL